MNDVLLDDQLDLVEEDNEWKEGESNQANVELIILFNKGELRQFPFLGFGIERRMKQVADRNTFIRDLKVEIERDGYSNPTVTASENLADLKIEI
jgi:hypothetical protein